MALLINASINLSKIDKTKIIVGKTGDKYYNIDIAVNDTLDNYGNNVAVSQKQTKEQREAKEKKVYLGNGKIVWTSAAAVTTPPAQPSQPLPQSNEPDDLPF